MKITLWGTRGSLPTPGKSADLYGGNTSCIEVRSKNNDLLILDAGTGIRKLGNTIDEKTPKIDILLTHLHMDHLQGLGFFKPLFKSKFEVNIWGPASTTMDLSKRLSLYMSPPLFPVRLRDLACTLHINNVPFEEFSIGPFRVKAELVCHPDSTVGYKICENDSCLVYIPDHELVLGSKTFPDAPEWTSGYDLAKNADILIHDAQYLESEYEGHLGWGHSTINQTISYAKAVGAKKLVLFHHDPEHEDQVMDDINKTLKKENPSLDVEIAREGNVYEI